METMIGGTAAMISPRGATTGATGPKAGDGAFAEVLETAQREVGESKPGAGEPVAETVPEPEQPSASGPEAAGGEVPAGDPPDESETAMEATEVDPLAEDQPEIMAEVAAKAKDADPLTVDQSKASKEPEDEESVTVPAVATDPEPSVTGLPTLDVAAGVVAAAMTSAESAEASGSSLVEGLESASAALSAGPTAALLPVVAEQQTQASETETETETTSRSDGGQTAAKVTAFVPAVPTPTMTHTSSLATPEATTSAATTEAPAPTPAAPATESGQGSAGDGQQVILGPDWTPAADLAFAEVPLSSLDDAGTNGLLSLREWLDPRLTAEPAPGQLLERLQQAMGQGRAATFEQVARTVLPQVTRGIATLVQDGSAEMRLQLSPPELGEIELRVRATDSTIQGQVTVQQPAVKHLLESQLGRLREALSAQGLQLAGFDVNVNRDPRSTSDRERGTGTGTSARIAKAEPAPAVETTTAPVRVGGGLHAVDYTI